MVDEATEGVSAVALQYCVDQLTAHRKAQVPVNPDGPFIACQHVKEGCLVLGEDLLHHPRHDGPRIAAPPRIGVSADATHFHQSSKAEPLAGHGHQICTVKDSEEGAQFDGAQPEGTGLGQFREIDHGGSIAGGQPPELCIALQSLMERWGATGVNHLRQRAKAHQSPPRWNHRSLLEEQRHHALGAGQRPQGLIAGRRLSRNSSQRADPGREAASQLSSFGERIVPGPQRVPDRIVEKVQLGLPDQRKYSKSVSIFILR